MNETVVRWQDLAATHWKNGRGITREIAVSPADSTNDTFDWRISIADIEDDGSFSPFPGVSRTITCLAGDGMTLELDGVDYQIFPSAPFTFSGDAITECRLTDGPTRNLNVMTRHGRARAAVTTMCAKELTIAARETFLLVSLSETLTATPAGSPPLTLHRLDTLTLTTPTTVAITGGTAAIVRIFPAADCPSGRVNLCAN